MKRSLSPSTAVTVQAILLLFCTMALIWGAVAVHLRQEYQRGLQDAENQTANLARAFEETVSRSIAVLDQSLEHVRDAYSRDPGHFTLDDWLRDKSVLRRISVQLGIADKAGSVVTTTVATGPPNVSIADREHFLVHVAAAEDRLFISKPVIGRSSGRLSIQLSRRMTNSDGSFAGVVIASLDPHVLGMFREPSEAGDGFAMLIGREGVIRSAWPDASIIGGTVLPGTIPEMARGAGEQSSAGGTETVARQDAIVSYRGVTSYPLFVVAGVSRQAAFASYDRARWESVLAGLCLSLIVLFVAAITLRQWHRLTRFQLALTMTMENISQGILMIDRRRRMPVVNRRVAELLGLPTELASPGGDFDALVRWQQEHGEADDDDRVATLLRKGGIDPDLPFYERTRGNGTVLEVRTTVLSDGSAVRTFTDVTERKRIEREMANARDAAEAGIRARTEFLAVMSHEIRTPMNGIIGAAGLLRDMPLNPEQHEYVRVIRDSGDHLSSLIQDILEFSRLDRGQLELEEIAFNPAALIRGTIVMLERQAQSKGLTLTSLVAGDVPARVSGDPSRLRRILVNLIGNGIKFTERGGVTVDTRLVAQDATTVTIGVAVSDSGIGIDPVSQQKLFSPFTQVDSSISRRFGGTGLGLVICARLVVLMGGTIDVDSAPGHGSTFRFSIVLRRVQGAPMVEPPCQDATTSRRRLNVLLAEDNPTNRHVATRMLTRMGHVVEAVDDGARAVKAAAAADYDVILMDMMMPEVDGITATRMIRAGEPPRCHTVIVGLTANARASDRAACEAAGMNGFVTKPVTLERLRGVLEQSAFQDRPAQDDASMPEGPLVDTAFLSQLAVEIGADGTSEVVRAFLEEAPGHLDAITRAMADGAIQSVRRSAHALTGAARNLGLARLGEAASMLQQVSERGLPDTACFEYLAAVLHDTLPLAEAWAEAHETLAPSSG